jgi:hypothetical protein
LAVASVCPDSGQRSGSGTLPGGSEAHKCLISTEISTGGGLKRFDRARSFPYTLRFVRGVSILTRATAKRLSGLEGKYLRSRNKVRRNGTEERPEWGASPAKPSKPLRTEARGIVLPSGVRTEFLAGCISGFAVDLSALKCALAHFCLRALREPRKILRANGDRGVVTHRS